MPSNYKIEYLGELEHGKMHGKMTITRPDRKEVECEYKNKEGCRQLAKITKGNELIYIGYLYHSLSCFNPIKEAIK